MEVDQVPSSMILNLYSRIYAVDELRELLISHSVILSPLQ